MSIIETEEKGIYTYTPSDQKEMYEDRQAILMRFHDYAAYQKDITDDDILVDDSVISEILIRVDKRKDYFKIFHNKTDIDELKETALIVYWLLKFRPFSVRVSAPEIMRKYVDVNERFALFLLFGAVKRAANMKGAKFSLKDDYIDLLDYAFRYWDLSKEAMMLVAETLYAAF